MKRTAGFVLAALAAAALGAPPTGRRSARRVRVCRSVGAGREPPTDDQDTSKGRPIGAHPGVDSWGNKDCKTF